MLHKIFLILSIAYSAQAATDRVICYYQSWAYYQPEPNGIVTPEHLDATLCTHINYAFIGLQENGALAVEDEYLDLDERLFKRVTALKKKNPNVKVLLSIGGANEERTYAFADIARDASKRAKFIQSSASFMTNMGLMVLMSTGNTQKKMTRYLDQINIMAYDMYGDWSDYIGQNSPLYPSSAESEWEKANLNVAAAIRNWKNAGAIAEKLNLGLAFYGRSFGLADPSKHGIHAAFSGPADPMPYLQDGYSYSYAEICQFTTNWTTVWDDEQQVPYRYKGRNWVGYDDPKSIELKVQYVASQGLGGVMMWSIDQDDVHGKCGEKFGLLRVIHKVLGV